MDNSRVFAPSADTDYDFHGIASDGLSLASFTNGVEQLLFKFQLPLDGCVEGIRLFENTSDITKPIMKTRELFVLTHYWLLFHLP